MRLIYIVVVLLFIFRENFQEIIKWMALITNLPSPPCPEEGPVREDDVVPERRDQLKSSKGDWYQPGHNPFSKPQP